MDTFRCATCTTDDEGNKTCTYENVAWLLMYANCPQTIVTCRGVTNVSAYVPVITVCGQRLL